MMIEPPDPSEKLSSPEWNGMDVIIMFLGILGIFALAILAIGFLSQFQAFNMQNPTDAENIGLTGLEGVALIGSVYIFGMYRRKLSWQDVGLRSLPIKWVLFAIVISIIIIPLSGIIAELILMALGRPIENPQLDFLVPKEFNWINGIIMLALAGGIASFAEELFFRGVIYQYLRNRWGIWPAVFISSFIFGIAHGDLAIGGAALVIGIVLALLYEYSHSLWAAIIVHAANNSIKIAILYAMLAMGLPLK
jgi:membrane protease YdiL (CAAX protease family)